MQLGRPGRQFSEKHFHSRHAKPTNTNGHNIRRKIATRSGHYNTPSQEKEAKKINKKWPTQVDRYERQTHKDKQKFNIQDETAHNKDKAYNKERACYRHHNQAQYQTAGNVDISSFQAISVTAQQRMIYVEYAKS